MRLLEKPFLVRDGDRYIPTDAGRGFWTPNSLRGRVSIGLLGHEIERLYGSPDFIPARFCVDLYAMTRISPLEMTTRVVRETGRLRLVHADLICEGVAVARASCQFLKRSEDPGAPVWTPPPWDAPPPEAFLEDDPPFDGWERRTIDSGPQGQVRRKIWMRETRELVAGVDLTPFVRVAVGADFVSPLTNMSEGGVHFINTDATVYLHREPADEWIGFEAMDHGETDGVSTGYGRLHDRHGAIGFLGCAAMAQRRPKK